MFEGALVGKQGPGPLSAFFSSPWAAPRGRDGCFQSHLEKELSVSEMCVCLFFVVAETVAHTGPKL